MIEGRALLPRNRAAPPAYSICTMVTRPDEYAAMVESFKAAGFADAEYLHVDNSASNVADAYAALNLFLIEAANPYIILCHQDIVLLGDGRDKLDQCIADLDRRHPAWGLAGNAGAQADGSLAIRITDPNGADQRRGAPFPARVVTLDENFIVARRDANLALSRDLEGFHFYGADLCLNAAALGWESYVIDFHLHHKSRGTLDQSFTTSWANFQAKHQTLMRPRWLPVATRQAVYLGPSRVGRFVARVVRKLGLGARRH